MESLRIEYRGFVIVPSDRLEGWFMTECETMCGESVAEVQQDLDSMIIEQAKGQKVTYYFQGDFGMSITEVEGKLVDIETRSWAQYRYSPSIKMIPKRKRLVREYRQTYKPFFLVVEGHGHPDMDKGWIDVQSSVPGIKVQKSRYTAFDPRWKEEGTSALDQYIQESGAKVIADYRESSGFTTHSGPVYHKAA